MANGDVQEHPLCWDDIASPSWYSGSDKGPIWITAYLIMMAERSQISPEPLTMDFEHAKAIAFYGQISYIRLSENEPKSTEVPLFGMKAEEVTSDKGAFLLLSLPFDDSAQSQSEAEIRARIQELLGILTAIFGPNVAYRHIFDNVVYPEKNQRTAFGESFRNPISLPIPDLRKNKAKLAELAVQQLLKLPEKERNRVRLSLRWYSEAQHSRGVDIFLKLWFALEALGMSDRKNVRPIVESLARSYQIDCESAKGLFSIGRLFGFRSRIVHQGKIVPINALLSDYLAALYQDVLYEKLKLDNQGFASAIQNDPGFDLEHFIGP